MGREPTRRESLHEVDVSIPLLWQNVGEEEHTTKKTARRIKICCNPSSMLYLEKRLRVVV
jgi:hypothetical protein